MGSDFAACLKSQQERPLCLYSYFGSQKYIQSSNNMPICLVVRVWSHSKNVLGVCAPRNIYKDSLLTWHAVQLFWFTKKLYKSSKHVPICLAVYLSICPYVPSSAPLAKLVLNIFFFDSCRPTPSRAPRCREYWHNISQLSNIFLCYSWWGLVLILGTIWKQLRSEMTP